MFRDGNEFTSVLNRSNAEIRSDPGRGSDWGVNSGLDSNDFVVVDETSDFIMDSGRCEPLVLVSESVTFILVLYSKEHTSLDLSNAVILFSAIPVLCLCLLLPRPTDCGSDEVDTVLTKRFENCMN